MGMRSNLSELIKKGYGCDDGNKIYGEKSTDAEEIFSLILFSPWLSVVPFYEPSFDFKGKIDVFLFYKSCHRMLKCSIHKAITKIWGFSWSLMLNNLRNKNDNFFPFELNLNAEDFDSIE